MSEYMEIYEELSGSGMPHLLCMTKDKDIFVYQYLIALKE